jgi:GNAT superfamily N-acetyltransferase
VDARLHDADEFIALAAPLYERDPVRHTIELTMLAAGIPHDAVLVTVSDGDEVIGAALQTPPHPLVVNGLDSGTVGCATDLLVRTHSGLAEVRGVRSAARAFTAAWESRLAVRGRLDLTERLYRLAELRPPVGVAGSHRIATGADHEWLAERVEDFFVEAFGDTRDIAAGRRYVADALTGGGRFVVWVVDDRPVSMALVRRPAAGASRLGPVHTSMQARGRGFGSAVTAAAADLARRSGAAEVVLFTDLADPVPNAIYQRIGFEPVADMLRIRFDPR